MFSTPSEILYEPANLLSISYFNLESAFTFSSASKVLVFSSVLTIGSNAPPSARKFSNLVQNGSFGLASIVLIGFNVIT